MSHCVYYAVRDAVRATGASTPNIENIMWNSYLFWKKYLQGDTEKNTHGAFAPYIAGAMIRSLFVQNSLWHEYHHRLLKPEHYATMFEPDDPRQRYFSQDYLGTHQDPLQIEGCVCMNIITHHAYYLPVGQEDPNPREGIVFAYRVYLMEEKWTLQTFLNRLWFRRRSRSLPAAGPSLQP